MEGKELAHCDKGSITGNGNCSFHESSGMDAGGKVHFSES
jgi:hypothetical protein